jgi:hypothetical protein
VKGEEKYHFHRPEIPSYLSHRVLITSYLPPGCEVDTKRPNTPSEDDVMLMRQREAVSFVSDRPKLWAERARGLALIWLQYCFYCICDCTVLNVYVALYIPMCMHHIPKALPITPENARR